MRRASALRMGASFKILYAPLTLGRIVSRLKLERIIGIGFDHREGPLP